MARLGRNQIGIRVDDVTFKRLEDFAIRFDLYNSYGEPNMAAAITALIGIGLDDGNGQMIAAQVYESIRKDLLHRFSAKIKEKFSDLASEI